MPLKPRYVFGEAWSIARSGPRQTALAVGLVALSFYIPGLFALVSKNLSRLSAGGESPAVVLTLEPGADARAVAHRLAEDTRLREVRIVTSEGALARFRRAYPDLGAALSDLNEAPFPATVEVRTRSSAAAGTAKEIADAAKSWPGVDSAESEADYGSRFADAVRMIRGAGLLLGGVLVLAAIFSVASAIRLALDLHREEIEIMRLMGATEAAVRAPFWLHAAGEGLLGGALAVALLYATYRAALSLLARTPHPILAVLWTTFLDWRTILMILALGCAAGFIGSVISIGRRR